MTEIKNLTPHPITIVVSDDISYIVAPCGIVARCTSETKVIGNINGIPKTQTVYGEVIGLPEPKENTIYIVSAIVAKACPNRDDLVIPNETIRDANGIVIGCKSLGIV